VIGVGGVDGVASGRARSEWPAPAALVLSRRVGFGLCEGAVIPGGGSVSKVIANPAMLHALRQEASMLRGEARKVPL
jgi:hypothetical protein